VTVYSLQIGRGKEKNERKEVNAEIAESVEDAEKRSGHWELW
jgi:hypothetical protein